ncbi:MAG: DUF1573 domain-containing protein [Planctomycetes bacterium]|nr:DUF1573 domain-containing protein [Planctomycetota bacterium]
MLASTPATVLALDNANAASPEEAPEVREIEPFKTVIQVFNPNDRAVRVKLIDTSCTCTTLDLNDHFLLPHGRTTLSVEIPDKNRSGPQSVHVSLFLTDPEYQPIEIEVLWKVRACIQVDAVAPRANPVERPTDKMWQDIYAYVTDERPDELNRLRKRIRLSCPAGEVPADGLKVLGIEYPGTLWKFVPTTQADGSVLITATARDEDATLAEGEFKEKVVIRTNHPDKSAIELNFMTLLSKDAGRRAVDPMDP